jgi:hypothetical protein
VLQDRLRSLLDDGGWPDVAGFDPEDERQFDAVARRLLRRFAHRRDAEAFALLMRLTRGRLLDIATRLAASRGSEVPPAALVEAVLARLFNDPPAGFESMGFFQRTRELMEGLTRSDATRPNGHTASNGLPGPLHIETGPCP